MVTWAIWTFGMIALNLVLQARAIGFGEYPRTITREADCINMLISVAWIIWGVCAIWGRS